MRLHELTISEFHHALASGEASCVELVEAYLERIISLDKATGLNSMVYLNPHAVRRARELDREARNRGLRPLHGVPVIVKDNFDTWDMPTTAGSVALLGSIPPDDACMVRRLREAGAVILGKSNMAEWAFSPYQTVSGVGGTTRNPYDLERVPAGSSGGTAAAVAANLGLVGLGTDTGNSIRGPSSHCCLVGLRPTMGLTSRDGIVPLYLRNDVGGPMCRSVEDCARLLDVLAGVDEADPITALSRGKIPETYSSSLRLDGLEGVRVGVFRFYTDAPTTDPRVLDLFEEAIEDLESLGAEVVDPFVIEGFQELSENLWCNTFKRDLSAYLASLGNPPYRSLEEIVNSGLYSAYIADRLKTMVEAPEPQCGSLYEEPRNIRLRAAVLRSMRLQGVDVFIHPTWSNPPRKVGDLESPHGDNSQKIPPHTGLPAITVPMGFTYEHLPAGLQIVAGLFEEPLLFQVAYAYEQRTKHRRSPEGF